MILVVLMIVSLCSVNVSAMTFYVEDFGFELNSTTSQATIVEYRGQDTDVKIPTKVYDYNVTALGDSLFSGNKSISSVSIPQSITEIGDNVFSGCTALESVSVPASVTSVGKIHL